MEKNMRTYKEHYEVAKANYTNSSPSKYNDVYDIRLDEDVFEKTPEYLELIDKISKQVHQKLEDGHDILENDWATHLNGWRDIKELNQLFDLIMPEIEKKVFKSNGHIQILHVYKNKPGANPDSSWLWHYDDCPEQFLKLVIYLTDVTEDNGCFQYLQNKDGDFPMVPTNRTYPGHNGMPYHFKGKRIPPEETQKRIEEGYEVKSLLGKAGTYALMHPNIYHRATVPAEGSTPRECLFFFIRPSVQKREIRRKNIYSVKPEINVKMYPLD
tara:strand:+ start:131 stop:940 length:810 start_codon:yes stop_codon:yes gene_type:complete